MSGNTHSMSDLKHSVDAGYTHLMGHIGCHVRLKNVDHGIG